MKFVMFEDDIFAVDKIVSVEIVYTDDNTEFDDSKQMEVQVRVGGYGVPEMTTSSYFFDNLRKAKEAVTALYVQLGQINS